MSLIVWPLTGIHFNIYSAIHGHKNYYNNFLLLQPGSTVSVTALTNTVVDPSAVLMCTVLHYSIIFRKRNNSLSATLPGIQDVYNICYNLYSMYLIW